MQKGPGFYQQHQGNRMVYSKHVQQLPNLSSQNSLMQAPMQTRPTFVSTSETHIRPIVENRMPIYSQGQPSEVTPGYPNHPYHVQGQYQNIQQFTPPYGNNYMPRNPQYPSVYVVPQGVAPQGGNYTNNPVVIAPTINPASQSHQIANQPQQQSQHLYPQMSSSQPPPIIQQQQQNDASFQKKRTAIKLTDPNTGKDLTNEVFTKKPVIKPAPVANSEENIKAKTAALFAAQVAKKIAASSEAEEGPQIETKADISEAAENETNKELTLPKETTSTEQNDSVDDSQNVNDADVSKNENGVTEIKITKTVNLVGSDKPADDVIEKILETKVPLENSPDTSQIILSDDLVLPPSGVDTPSVTNASAIPVEVPLISSCETDAPKGEPVSQLSEGDGFVDKNITDDVQEVPPVIKNIDSVQELAGKEKVGPGKPSESQNTQPIPKGTEIPRIKEVPVNPTVESVVEGAVEDNVEKKEETSVTKTVTQTNSDVEIKTKGVSLPDPNAAETNENIQFMSEESEECKFKTESDSILSSSKIEQNVTDQDKKEITVDQASDKVNAIPESKSVTEEACDDVSVVEFTNVTDNISTVAEKESLLTKNKDSAFTEEPAKNEKNKKNQKNKKKDKKAATAACSIQVEAQNKGDTSKDVPCKEVPLEKDIDTQKEENDNTDKSDEDNETENLVETKEEDSKSDKDLDMEEKKTENTGAPAGEEETTSKEKETKPPETEKSEAVGCQKMNNGTKDSEESSNKPSQKPMEKEDSGKPTSETKAKTKEDAIRRFEPSFSFKPKEPVKPERKIIDPIKKDVSTEKESSNLGVVNGHDEVVKSATIINPVKKKKNKNRFKDIELKESNDLLSAFVDAPKEVKEEPKEPVLVAEKPPEEATWEDKEDKEIEDIRGEDEDSQANKKVQTKISKVESNTEERHQYDRDFLLKFQFSPICTSKPVGLPDIDIILDQAHAPTKAVVPGTSISTGNNFMPTFMRQASGGRNTSSGGGGGGFGGGRGSGGGGGRNSREKDRGSQNAPSRQQQKVISIPQFEKVELKKSENAWVRPGEKVKNMSQDEKELYDVDRAVCSILNKLTPQKFKPLVQQMTDLKLSNGTKLEKAISLIFEKAISEPGFSVAYANMCRVLTEAFNKVPATNEPNAPVVTFRKILLNKCQTEFEKESKDEKELEEQRNRTFDTEEERKFNLEEIAYKERANRRRTLGNIRFIGELYKLKMISEPIMHDCIYKLLKAEKQDSLEDQLECLCKLLATIGKILDHAKAKPIMDQYFDQMHKIIEKRKISSRIKFAMKDVIDLRKNQWVPRRDEGAPKTIDQIHREAQEKEKEEEKARQQEKIAKKLEPKGGRGGGGGRDSPSMRPGGGKAPTSDGWNTVPNKSTRQMPAPVDVSKLRFRKADTSDNISLGPGGRPGAWSKGASGGGSSRSSSGTKPPNVERDQRMNRFDALSDNSNSFERNFDRSGGSRKGSQEGVRNRNDRDRNDRPDRHDAFRSVRDVSGPGSRNQSPGPGSRSQSPALVRSRNQSPAPARTPDEQSRGRVTAPEPVTEDKMRKVTKSTIEEFLSVRDEKEVMLCIKELRSPSMHHIFVEESMTIALEKKPDDRRGVGMIFNKMLKEGVIDVNQVCRGLATIVEFAPDFAVDIPHIYKYVGEIIGPIIVNGILPLGKVRDSLKPLIQIGKAGTVMAVVLSVAVQITNREDMIAELWINANMSWDELLQSNVEEFLKDHKLEFTVKSPSPPAPSSSHGNQMQEELLQILRQSNSDKNDQAISYIESHMKSAELKTPEFIRLLTTVVCTSTISKDSENNCTCKRDLLKKRKTILLRYIDRSKDLELQSLFAIQQLVEDLKHPRGVLHAIFDELYQGDIVSEETFFLWESSKESPVGKGPALSSVKDFLSWLRKADEESNDDEESSTLTNT